MEVNVPTGAGLPASAVPQAPPIAPNELIVAAVIPLVSAASADRGVRNNTSGYRGVSYDTKAGKWRAQISVDGKCSKLGTFDSPEAAALKYDVLARGLGRPTNLPPDFVPPTTEATNGGSPRPRKKGSGNSSKYKGVSWYPSSRKWVAQIRIDGKKKGLGLHDTEEAAARTYDEHASYLGRPLNFPTTEGQRQAVKGGSNGGSSRYKGVSWSGKDSMWRAAIKLDGKTTYLGRFECEVDAARKYDEQAFLKGWTTNFDPQPSKSGHGSFSSGGKSSNDCIGGGNDLSLTSGAAGTDALGFGIDMDTLGSSSVDDDVARAVGRAVGVGGCGTGGSTGGGGGNMMMMLMHGGDDPSGAVNVLDTLNVGSIIMGSDLEEPQTKRCKTDEPHLQQQNVPMQHESLPFAQQSTILHVQPAGGGTQGAGGVVSLSATEQYRHTQPQVQVQQVQVTAVAVAVDHTETSIAI